NAPARRSSRARGSASAGSSRRRTNDEAGVVGCTGSGRVDAVMWYNEMAGAVPRHVPKVYGGRTIKVRPPSNLDRSRLLAGRSGNVLRRNADDLHSRATSDIHGVDNVSIFHLRITLHEDDLLGPIHVDILEPCAEARLVDLLRIDREHTAGHHLEHD